MPLLIVRVDAVPEKGLGHMMRCISFADFFKSSIKDATVKFVSYVDTKVFPHLS